MLKTPKPLPSSKPFVDDWFSTTNNPPAVINLTHSRGWTIDIHDYALSALRELREAVWRSVGVAIACTRLIVYVQRSRTTYRLIDVQLSSALETVDTRRSPCKTRYVFSPASQSSPSSAARMSRKNASKCKNRFVTFLRWSTHCVSLCRSVCTRVKYHAVDCRWYQSSCFKCITSELRNSAVLLSGEKRRRWKTVIKIIIIIIIVK